MRDLMYYTQSHPHLTVTQALSSLVESYPPLPAQANPHMQQQPQQGQQIGYAPNGLPEQFQQFQPGARMPHSQAMGRHPSEGFVMSPAMQSSLLPGSQANGSPHMGQMGLANAHTPSPAHVHMAPPMVAQVSQQGSTTGASSNTSPSGGAGGVKRRRSTAQVTKMEPDENNEVNGVMPKVKPSPRMNNHKRLKGS
ncbi:hypothetical protein EJ06DRAFT_8661 [Trichodelitschia bisporula]|uniref:Uncharacterized protein n=1 Tax=Trichodelitschia bisporula TaxID=703511 RepID=A0A6G1I9Z7_9PEZI|nr:hypothetical protein EJ06DRAFT_8661 [Trichodelitschia bisporula]